MPLSTNRAKKVSSCGFATVPMYEIGTLNYSYLGIKNETCVPLATFEKPLIASVLRGMNVSSLTDGIKTHVPFDAMTRSVIVEVENLESANALRLWILNNFALANDVIKSTGKYVTLTNIFFETIGNLLYIRLEMTTCEAAGHNMTTKAADCFLKWLLENTKQLGTKYVAISGNYCSDKKVSSVNGILGRGKRVEAEIVIPRSICKDILRTTPEKIVDLNFKKNYIGSSLAGSVRSCNAHFANVLFAFYIATGQDVANIVEGSQGFTYAAITDNDELYFSVTLPNIIVGTIGNGKTFDFVKNNFELMKCTNDSKKLAAICGAVVLCGELSLMCAQTNIGELVRAHMIIERGSKC